MLCTRRYLALFVGCAIISAIVTPSQAQQKKGAVGAVVEPTDKSGKWGAVQAKVGIRMISDRDYLLAALPKEMIGGTFILRSSGEYGSWLPDGALKAKQNLTVYAIVRVKYIGKDTFPEESQKLFIKDGWKEVDGKVGTTSPKGENWEWKAFKKDIDEGLVSLPLKELSWEKKGTAVLFLFKDRDKAKP